MTTLTDDDGPAAPTPVGGTGGQTSDGPAGTQQNGQQMPPRRMFRRMISAALVLLIVVLLGAWISRGRNPSVVPGDVSADPGGPMRVATDGIQPTRWVLDGNAAGEGTLRLSIRNHGRAPITVLGLGGADSVSATDIGWWGTARFRFLSLRSDISYDLPASPTVQLGPGEQAIVAVTVHAPRCPEYVAGSALEANTLPLKVRSLGLTTEQDVALPLTLTITFAQTHEPGANCG